MKIISIMHASALDKARNNNISEENMAHMRGKLAYGKYVAKESESGGSIGAIVATS